ncbi:MAG: nucleotide exchange factor GrpE [Candidatus Omnitrophota bacterium]
MNNKKEDKPEEEILHPQDEKKLISINEDELILLREEAKKAKDCWDKYLRLQAEFDNVRKRMQKEQDLFIKFANEGLIVELLGILDDLERTVEAAEEEREDFTTFLKGIEMILAHLYELLKKKGLLPIEAKGKKFDPSMHEALLVEETDKFPENVVIEELQKGYKLEDRVIRTAKVKVATAKKQK